MRVLWISHAGTLEGAELTLREAAAGLRERGVGVHVVVPAEGKLLHALAVRGIPSSVIPHAPWTRGGRLPRGRGRAWNRNLRRALPRLRRLIAEQEPDVVVTNTLTVPTGAFAARRSGVPHVWYVHELMAPDHALRFDLGRRITLGLVGRLSRRIIANSRTTRDAYAASLPAAKMRVILAGVPVPDVERPERAPETLKVIVVGHRRPGKRQDEAIRALDRLIRRGCPAELTLLGDEAPGHGARLHRLSSDLGVADRVRVLPFTNDPFAEMAAADVVLVCSRRESFGRVAVEAMKVGTPVVAADSGGLAELVSDGETGFLYPPGDVEGLAGLLAALHRDRARLERTARRARSWAIETFDQERYVSDLHGVLEEAIAEGRSAGA